jgi:AraC family transcriptional regulator
MASQHQQHRSAFHVGSAPADARAVDYPGSDPLNQVAAVLPPSHDVQAFSDTRGVTVRQLGLVAGLMESLANKRLAGAELEYPEDDDVDPSLQALAQTALTERLRTAALAENPNDRIVRSLSAALATAEQGEDRDCVDALRIAMAIRLLGLRTEARAAVPNEVKTSKRQVCALQKWRLKRVLEYIEQHLSEKIGLHDLAAVAGLSRMHFASQFRHATGRRPHEFLLKRRVRRAEELLRDTSTSIVEISLIVGFQTQAHFTTVFKRFTGCTPHKWRAIKQPNQSPRLQGGRQAGALDWSQA